MWLDRSAKLRIVKRGTRLSVSWPVYVPQQLPLGNMLINRASSPPAPHALDMPGRMRLYLPTCCDGPSSRSGPPDDYPDCPVSWEMALPSNPRHAGAVLGSVFCAELPGPLAGHGSNSRVGSGLALTAEILSGIRVLWPGMLDVQHDLPLP